MQRDFLEHINESDWNGSLGVPAALFSHRVKKEQTTKQCKSKRMLELSIE